MTEIVQIITAVNAIVMIFAIYQLYFKKKKKLGNHILAYSFLIQACDNILMQRERFFICLAFMASICAFMEYLHTREGS